MHKLPFLLIACLAAASSAANGAACRAQSPEMRTPVIELYTSEGCSSCPPADRWISGLKQSAAAGQVVVEAFHVSYWDSLGWVDRFAAPAYNARQREIAARSRAANVYTPQLVRDGQDARNYDSVLAVKPERAGAIIRLERDGPDATAEVTTAAPGRPWSAYWTVTEHGHASKVAAGENAGEFLQHDFVVRQYVEVAPQHGHGKLSLRTVPATPGHPQQVNLVVFDRATGKPLQALSLACTD